MRHIRSVLGKDLSPLGYGWAGHCIATCDDFNEKESVKIGGVDVFMKPEINNNHRVSHPQIGTVVSSSGNNDYKKGDKIFCFHFTFTNENKTPKIDMLVDDKMYVKVINNDIVGKIVEGELIPRKGILLCSPVGYAEGEVLKIQDKRRDLLKVETIPYDCEEIKVGDYILIEEGADYYLDFNGKEYIAVDMEFDDVVAVVDGIDWEINEVRKHITDYSVA